MEDADHDFAGREPDGEGFRAWRPPAKGRFVDVLGDICSRAEGDRARCRVTPERRHSNGMDMLHGGYIQAYIDQALFYGLVTLGRLRPGDAVTLSSSTDFTGAGRIGVPLDAVIEPVRETGRMIFVRGLLEQEGEVVAMFQATLKKIGRPAGR